MMNKLKQFVNRVRDKKAQLIFNKVLAHDDLTPKHHAGMCTALTCAVKRGIITDSERTFAFKQIDKLVGGHLYLSFKLCAGVDKRNRPSTHNIREHIYRNWKDRQAIIYEFRDNVL